jgi:glycosyltransferase involved in cell wall biosynthesis
MMQEPIGSRLPSVGRNQAACFHQFLVSRDLGGGGAVALRLAHDLGRRNHPSRVWIPGDGAAREEAGRLGLASSPLDFSRARSTSRVGAAWGNWQLSRQLRRFGPGLVHVHAPLYYGSVRWGLRLAGLKRVVHVQLEEGIDGLRWAFKDPPELIITCARFLADHVRRALPEQHQERQRIVAVPNSVDTERFTPGDRRAARQKVGVPPGVPLVLMLANLAPHKGQETAIRAVAALKQRGLTVHAWLAGIERGGEGVYTARLNSLVGELGVGDRVRLLGQRGDTPDLLRAADFLLLPSTCEGLPLAVLEAQATRVPVLAAPTAGIPEVIQDGETGFLIAAADAAGYAHRIADLLANPGRYHAIAGRAHARTTRDYNWRAFSSRVVELYHEVIGTPVEARLCRTESVVAPGTIG